MRGLSLKEGEERSYLCLISETPSVSVRPSDRREGGREGATGIACAPTFALHPPAPLPSPLLLYVQPHRTPFGGCAKL